MSINMASLLGWLSKSTEPTWPELLEKKRAMQRQADAYTQVYRNNSLPCATRAEAAQGYVLEAQKLVRHTATMATAGGRAQTLEDYDPRLVAIVAEELRYIAKHFKNWHGCYEGVVVIIRSPHFPKHVQEQVLYN